MLSSRKRISLTALLAFGVGLAVAGWLCWLCFHSPDVRFLTRGEPAEWILYPTPPDAVAHPIRDGKTELITVFRRSFDAGSLPASAKLQVRALENYLITINGNTATPSSSRPENWKEIAEFEIASLLHPGTNQLLVTVTNLAAPPALWLALTCDDRKLATDASWECSCSGAVWQKAAFASSQREIQPGNALYGGESVLFSVQQCWPMLLSIIFIAAGLVYMIHRWGSQTQETRWILFALVVVWIALAVNNIASIPAFCGFDSRQHLNYIGYIMEEHSLPLANEGYEMHQPPLYYILSALSLGLLGIPVNTSTAIFILRTMTMLLGIAQIFLVWASLRLLFPNHPRRQVLGVLLAGCLPAHLITSHYITNETTLAVFVSATLYLLLRVLVAKDQHWYAYAGLGGCLGAALLSKITALLVVPWVFLALIAQLIRLKERRIQNWLRTLGIVALTCFVVSGWHYIRVWQNFGNPLGWHRQWSYGSGWWQENGYRTADYYLHFGASLNRPYYSAFNSFADGVYSTLFGEGLYAGVVNTPDRPPWNYNLMNAGYFFALLPTFGFVAGVLLALWRLIRKPSIPWAVFMGLLGSFGLAMLYNSLQVPGYGSARASFGLLTLLPFCAFTALGLDTLLAWRSWLRNTALAVLAAWALLAVSSLWVARQSISARFLQARMAMDAKNFTRAAELAQACLQANPNAIEAQMLYTDALFRLGRSDHALQLAEKYVEEHPGSALARLDLSSLLSEQHQFEPALIHARRAVELAPDNFRARYHLAKILLERKHLPEAAEAARECLRLQPWDAEARALLEKASEKALSE